MRRIGGLLLISRPESRMLAGRHKAEHIAPMTLSVRAAALLCTLAAALALGIALASETWGGLVPCALCLWERWPYRIAIALGLVALVLPPRVARPVLALLLVAILAGAAFATVHVGVEQGWWPSPLPECAAPKFHGGSIAERLANMPVRPAKPCDDPTYLVPGLPVSMAEMNLIYAVGFAAILALYLARGLRRPR
jgi:disulfide bond formation protein DsbB